MVIRGRPFENRVIDAWHEIQYYLPSATTIMRKRNIYIINNVNIPFRHDSGSTDYKFCNQFMVVIGVHAHVQCRMPFMSPL